MLGDDAVDSRLLGGKGASLDRLARLGFLVPPGFCLTIDAFIAQLDGIADQPRLRAAVAALPDETARQTVVAIVADSPLTDGVAGALDAAIDRLAAVASAPLSVAVRSSAVDEDSAVASFAGLHATELGVRREDIPAAVARCWASLWSAEAVAYRVRHGGSLTDVAMAVVVQSLVPADAAAVVFTRHPVTGRDDRILVDAVRGLGDAMVSGLVTPDSYLIDKAGRTVVGSTSGSAPDGPALQPGALADLTELALEVERRFGANVDLEAALAGDRWFLLQARPITTR